MRCDKSDYDNDYDNDNDTENIALSSPRAVDSASE